MGDSYDSQRLKDLIQSFRDCKTAAEERALILREKAIIRNSFIEQEHQFRLRNLAKLIWINMLGFETDFGQLECLNSLCTEDFSLKKIGYLGLSIFFSEKSEILLMATNRIRVDLQDKNQYVVSLALTAFSEIADENMCRELLPTVLLKLKSTQKYIRKKAMLTSLRVLRKVPDLVSEFTPFLSDLIDTKNHALLMCCLTLAQTVITIDPTLKKHFKNHTKALMKLLKELSITYSTEYDCDGINDPFLQATILEFLHAMSDDENIKDDFCGLLATLTCNQPSKPNQALSGGSSNSNSCNMVLFECVKIIMEINSTATLKKIGVTILGNFQTYKDVNSKYISQRTLVTASHFYKEAVLKHLPIIMESLKQEDITMRRMTQEILKNIVSEDNVNNIVKNLFNDMLTCSDEALEETVPKVANIIEMHAPSKVWYITAMIRVLIISGNYVSSNVANSLLNIISSTNEIQAYAAYKIYLAYFEHPNQKALAQVFLWIAGEFGAILKEGLDPVSHKVLPKVTEDAMITLVENILITFEDKITQQIGMNTAIKLWNRCASEANRTRLKRMIRDRRAHVDFETQIRSNEYRNLLSKAWDGKRAPVLEAIPPPLQTLSYVSEKPTGAMDLASIAKTKLPTEPRKLVSKEKNPDVDQDSPLKVQASPTKAVEKEVDILGFEDEAPVVAEKIPKKKAPKKTPKVSPKKVSEDLDIFGNSPQVDTAIPSNPPPQKKSPTADLLEMDIFGEPAQVTHQQQPAQSVQPQATGGFLDNDLFGDPLTIDAAPAQQQLPASNNMGTLDFIGGDLLGGPSDLFGSNEIGQPQNPPMGQNQDMILFDNPLGGNTGGDVVLGGEQPVVPTQQQPQSFEAEQFAGLDLLGGTNNNQTREPMFSDGLLVLQAYNDPQLEILFNCKMEGDKARIEAVFNNKNGSELTDLKLQIAVKKYLKLTLNQPNSDRLGPFSCGELKQTMLIHNTCAGEKPISLQIKIKYISVNGLVEKTQTLNSFPLNFQM